MGPGELFARRLATDGATVVITDINEAGAHETIRQIENTGGRAAFYRRMSASPARCTN